MDGTSGKFLRSVEEDQLMNDLSDAPQNATLSSRLNEAASARAHPGREVTCEVVVTSDGPAERRAADVDGPGPDPTRPSDGGVAITGGGSAPAHDVSALYIPDPQPRRSWWRRANGADSAHVPPPIGSLGGHLMDVARPALIDHLSDTVEVVGDVTTEHHRSDQDVTARSTHAEVLPDAPVPLAAEHVPVALRPSSPEPLRPLRVLARDLGVVQPVRGHRRILSIRS